jgi:hypothetical protein
MLPVLFLLPQRILFWLSAVGILLLAGCAPTATIVRSEVVANHDQALDTVAKTYAFAPDAEQRSDPTYQQAEQLVQTELQRLGFTRTDRAQLSVTLAYRIAARDVRVVQPEIISPWYGSPWYGSPWYGPGWGPFGYSPFYPDPFWAGPPLTAPVERQFVVYSRELKIAMLRGEDRHAVYQVTVRSEGSNPSLAAVMPAMVRSAFADFPGPNGVPRVIDMKLDPVR